MDVIGMARALALTFLALFLAMVWLPLGQTEFLAAHWMKIGTYMAPVLVFFAFKGREGNNQPALTDVTFMATLMAAAYMIHQFEEHWIDLLGRQYPLYEYLNTLIASVAGEDRYGVMTPAAIFYINTGLVWTIAFLAILVSPNHIFPALAMAGIMLVNGVSHVLAAIAAFEYNSGLLTSVVLFLPISLSFYSATRRAGLASIQMIMAGVAWGFLGHVVLFAGLFAANVYNLIPIGLYYVLLILWGLSPWLFYRSRKP